MKTHFTQREMTIINEFIKGKTNNEIADSLHISLGTVKFYMGEILRKTNCKDRLHLLIYLLSNPEGIELCNQAKDFANNLKQLF